jgi:hypothetical protein
MSVKGGPDIVTDGLVFNLDAAGAVSDKGYDPEGLRIEYLIVAGGGGGSGWGDGVGGGAGGFLLNSTKLTAGTHTVTVGAGGGRGTNSSGSRGSNGGDSQIGASLIAYGGGGAGCKTIQDGLDGGSGGGGYGNNAVPHGIGGSGVPGQGNDGGDGTASYRGGSGGGAGAAGTPGTSAPSNGLSKVPGGIGRVAKIDFNWQYYAGGGGVGGCCSRGDGSGGLGGGGSGGDTNTDGVAGTANTGGGGGGGGSYFNRATFGGNGGSGIVMIRYRGKQKATGGDSIVYKNGYTIHTFTSSGSFVLDETVDGLSTSKIVGTLNNMGSSNYSSANKGYFTFDGSNEYINLNTTFSDYIGVSLPTTWEAFVYLNTSNNNETIIGSSWATGGVLFRKTGSPHTPSNRIRFLYFTNGSAGTGFDSQSTFASGWHHFVATYNGSGLSYGNFNFYHNGIIANITNPTFGTPTTIPNRTFNVGGISAENTAYWSGNIAYVKLYNKLLSADQILDNYNATKGRFGL